MICVSWFGERRKHSEVQKKPSRFEGKIDDFNNKWERLIRSTYPKEKAERIIRINKQKVAETKKLVQDWKDEIQAESEVS